METHSLICHPETAAGTIDSVDVSLERDGGMVWLRYHVECRLEDLALAGPTDLAGRKDGLWKTTCFELFIGTASYCEFNFSPSKDWAAYDFVGYRAGASDRAVEQAPRIDLDASEGHFAMEVVLDVTGLVGPIALSAVIEELDGTKSYWALAHPPGKPDFHHPTCFAATLPAPNAP